MTAKRYPLERIVCKAGHRLATHRNANNQCRKCFVVVRAKWVANNPTRAREISQEYERRLRSLNHPDTDKWLNEP